MSLVIVIKVVDSLGFVLRYEDTDGNILAIIEEDPIFNTERMTITQAGIKAGYMLINGRIVKKRPNIYREIKKESRDE